MPYFGSFKSALWANYTNLERSLAPFYQSLNIIGQVHLHLSKNPFFKAHITALKKRPFLFQSAKNMQATRTKKAQQRISDL